jgi:serine kinase of HPr protein (carbohydrate metabolism regulator)
VSEVLHAGLVALRVDGLWRGALIEGASGAGKSDLALRALDLGFALVADDRTAAWREGAALFGAAPPPLQGLIEVRGQGVLPVPRRPFARIELVVRCVGAEVEVERMPDPQTTTVCGAALPVLLLHAFEASAPFKLAVALRHLPARTG